MEAFGENDDEPCYLSPAHEGSGAQASRRHRLRQARSRTSGGKKATETNTAKAIEMWRLTVHDGVWAEVQPKRNITIAVLNDVHVPFQDPTAWSLALTILRDVQPDIVVVNGDFVDFFAISRFSKDPRRKLELGLEIKEARSVLQQLFERVPTRQWIFIEGNHEARLRAFIWNRAVELIGLDELELPNLLRLDGVLYLRHPDTPCPTDTFAAPLVRMGMLYILHGDTFRMVSTAVNVARCLFLRTLKNLIVGHWHRADVWVQKDFEGHEHGCWIVPCLALPRPHWDSGRIWGQGLALVEMTPRGFFRVELVHFINENGYLLAFVDKKAYRQRRDKG